MKKAFVCVLSLVLLVQTTPLLEFQNRWGVPSKEDVQKLNMKRIVNEFQVDPDAPLIPLVIVPSLIGTALEATLKNAQPGHWWCDSNSDAYRLWLNTYQFYPYIIQCWAANMQLQYDPITKEYSNPPGVQVEAVDFGGVDGVAYLDEEKQAPIWEQIIQGLVDVGYQIGTNIRSASYDWRVGVDGLNNQFTLLKNLIEETYEMNNQTRVATTSLSMGSPYFVQFLNNFVDQAWKDKYIHSFTSLSGPFGGSLWAFSALVQALPQIQGLTQEEWSGMMNTWGSIIWMLPTAQVYGDEAILIGNNHNYSSAQFGDYFMENQMKTAYQIWNNSEVLRNTVKAPGVRINCVYGYNVSTLFQLDITTANFTTINADGDGTVSTPSLQLCDSWQSQQTQPVQITRIEGMQHGAAVANGEAIRVLFRTLLEG